MLPHADEDTQKKLNTFCVCAASTQRATAETTTTLAKGCAKSRGKDGCQSYQEFVKEVSNKFNTMVTNYFDILHPLGRVLASEFYCCVLEFPSTALTMQMCPISIGHKVVPDPPNISDGDPWYVVLWAWLNLILSSTRRSQMCWWQDAQVPFIRGVLGRR